MATDIATLHSKRTVPKDSESEDRETVVRFVLDSIVEAVKELKSNHFFI